MSALTVVSSVFVLNLHHQESVKPISNMASARAIGKLLPHQWLSRRVQWRKVFLHWLPPLVRLRLDLNKEYNKMLKEEEKGMHRCRHAETDASHLSRARFASAGATAQCHSENHRGRRRRGHRQAAHVQ